MTRHEYEQYKQAVKDFFEREGINSLSSKPTGKDANGDDTYDQEPFFSWTGCDVCDRPDGGNREIMIGYNPVTREVQGDYYACVDCVYYVEYGQLDDMTMLDIEAA